MSAISWKSAIDGDWYKQKFWDLNRPPQQGDDVSIGGLGGTYTVSVGVNPHDANAPVDLTSLTISDAGATVDFAHPKGVLISGGFTNYGTGEL